MKREDVGARMIASLPSSIVAPGLRERQVTRHEPLSSLPLPKHWYEVGGVVRSLEGCRSRAASQRAPFTVAWPVVQPWRRPSRLALAGAFGGRPLPHHCRNCRRVLRQFPANLPQTMRHSWDRWDTKRKSRIQDPALFLLILAPQAARFANALGERNRTGSDVRTVLRGRSQCDSENFEPARRDRLAGSR